MNTTKCNKKIPSATCLCILGMMCVRLDAAPVFWDPAAGGNGHYFDAIAAPEGITWLDAKAQAESAGGYLASITTADENSFVFGLIEHNEQVWKSVHGYSIGPWIGGVRSLPVGGWQWVTGEPMVFTAWAPSEPNNVWGNDNAVCYQNVGVTARQPTWNDAPSTNFPPAYTLSMPRGFVIEFDYAALVITAQPQSQIGYWGKSVAFSVSATGGAPPYTYQWLKDGDPISGATGSQLLIPSLQGTDAGAYTVTVTDTANHSVNSQPPATLTVLPDVGIATYAGLTIKGGVGNTYGIQATTDMTASTWTGVANVTLTQSTQLWYDSQSTAQQPKRFYRVVAGPISIP